MQATIEEVSVSRRTQLKRTLFRGGRSERGLSFAEAAVEEDSVSRRTQLKRSMFHGGAVEEDSVSRRPQLLG
jgi:hypothetical protein